MDGCKKLRRCPSKVGWHLCTVPGYRIYLTTVNSHMFKSITCRDHSDVHLYRGLGIPSDFARLPGALLLEILNISKKIDSTGGPETGLFIMHDVLENRTKVQYVVSAVENDPPKDRKRPLT